MAMDANLVAAYRDAKMAGVPQQDHVAAAISQLNGMVFQMAKDIADRKAEERRLAAEEAATEAELALRRDTLAQEKEIQEKQLEISRETNRINAEQNLIEVDRTNALQGKFQIEGSSYGQGWYDTLKQACDAGGGEYTPEETDEDGLPIPGTATCVYPKKETIETIKTETKIDWASIDTKAKCDEAGGQWDGSTCGPITETETTGTGTETTGTGTETTKIKPETEVKTYDSFKSYQADHKDATRRDWRDYKESQTSETGFNEVEGGAVEKEMSYSPGGKYNSAFHYNSPLHASDESLRQHNAVIGGLLEEQQLGIQEKGDAIEEELLAMKKERVFESPEWKQQTKDEVGQLTGAPSGLSPAMYEQNQIVIQRTKERAFGENRWKLIAETIDNPIAMEELIASGSLGDETEANEMIEEYTQLSAKGLKPETIYRNKQNEAKAYITALATQNANHKQTIETVSQTVAGSAGKLSAYAEYDKTNEFYNMSKDFLNPESPVELQEDGSFNIFSPNINDWINAGMMEGVVASNLLDAATINKIQSSIKKFKDLGLHDGKHPNPKYTLPDDGDLMGIIDGVVRSSNIVSMCFDDILNNNSSFYKDLESHPDYQALTSELDPTLDTPLTLEDAEHVKDAIVNPKNEFFDQERTIDLLKKYIVERQKQAYEKANSIHNKNLDEENKTSYIRYN